MCCICTRVYGTMDASDFPTCEHPSASASSSAIAYVRSRVCPSHGLDAAGVRMGRSYVIPAPLPVSLCKAGRKNLLYDHHGRLPSSVTIDLAHHCGSSWIFYLMMVQSKIDDDYTIDDREDNRRSLVLGVRLALVLAMRLVCSGHALTSASRGGGEGVGGGGGPTGRSYDRLLLDDHLARGEAAGGRPACPLTGALLEDRPPLYAPNVSLRQVSVVLLNICNERVYYIYIHTYM
jgi:hypothetical protein